MARSVFKPPRVVVVVAGQQLHHTTDFVHRSPTDGAANETASGSDYYFYKQVARSLLLRVYIVCAYAEWNYAYNYYYIVQCYYFNCAGR
jgi:hypothetical protein